MKLNLILGKILKKVKIPFVLLWVVIINTVKRQKFMITSLDRAYSGSDRDSVSFAALRYFMDTKFNAYYRDYLGAGAYGTSVLGQVYKNGKSSSYVFKLTSDLQETKLWTYLLKHGDEYTCFCKIYDVIKLYSTKGKYYGAIIVKEYVDILEMDINHNFMINVDDYDEPDSIDSDNFIFCDYNVEEVVNETFKNTRYASNDVYKNCLLKFGEDKEVFEKELNKIKDIFNWEILDINMGNWGFNGDNWSFRIFDITSLKSKSPLPKKRK